MRRTEFEGEFDQILRMLREHSFLLYAPSARGEYESKVMAAYTHFQSLVLESTGLELPYDNAFAEELSRLRSPDVALLIRTVSRTGARLLAAGRKDQARPWIETASALRMMR